MPVDVTKASSPAVVATSTSPKGRVLIVDDEPDLLRSYRRILQAAGYAVEGASDGFKAIELLNSKGFDVIVSDISMPEMDGISLLRKVREHDLDVPVIIVTATPALRTVMQALEHGALRYLLKPIDGKTLLAVVAHAMRLHLLAKLKREALEHLGAVDKQIGDRAGLEANFNRAMQSMWMAFQPILRWSQREVFGYEALLRSKEPSLPHPGAMLDAAERLGRVHDLGRAIRDLTCEAAAAMPPQTILFVNLHTHDLLDDSLFDGDSRLSKIASRVVLEITERASLDDVKDVAARVGRLRKLGFRLAIDDLGAGYAGLTSFAHIEPEVVKLDMSLVRNVNEEPTKQKLIRSMTSLCTEMGMLVVAEGIETPGERDTLLSLGCHLLQGYLFARPGSPLPPVNW